MKICRAILSRAIISVVLASGLAGCDMVDVISNGLSYSRVVETDLEQATGLKPEVGFNWRNSALAKRFNGRGATRQLQRSVWGDVDYFGAGNSRDH